jgi:hypothetical protein
VIPDQLLEYPLIRVCRPNCRSHNNCGNEGKRPVTAADDPDPNNRIKSWINRGGNYGVVPAPDNDLVVFDVDSTEMAEILSRKLPSTFRVESGGADFGEHWYYRCPRASDQRNWDYPEGGVNVDYWMVVGPGSVHAETGNRYEILDDKEIAKISIDEYRAVYDILTEIHNSKTADVERGGGGEGGGDPPPAALSTPDGLDFINSREHREKVARILSKLDAPHRDRLWLAGWLWSAAGLRQREIVDLIDQECEWVDFDRSITSKMVDSVIRSTDSDRGTHPSEFEDTSTGDMDFLQSESRKMEESGKGRTLRGGESEMTEDNINNKVTNENGDGKFTRAAIVKVDNGDDSWEYAGVVFGSIDEDDDELGTVVEFEQDQYGNRDYKNLGDRSPDELRMAAEALTDLADEIED